MEQHCFNEALCCAGKAAHPTQRQAKAVLKRMMRRRLRGSRLDVYRCAKCRLWHIGNVTRTVNVEKWRRERRSPAADAGDADPMMGEAQP